jgi:Protein of unknown function (DUF2637)
VNRLAPFAWIAVLGMALALSWWSLDTLGRHYGMPVVLAGMVSATFDGGALVAGDLALMRAEKGRSAFGVKLLMLSSVGLSAWLNWEHGELLGYPVAARVLFAAPSVIAGWLFELQLGSMRADRQPKDNSSSLVPRLGGLVWALHPWAALRRMSQISGSRLRSVPISVADWKVVDEGTPVVVAATPLSEPVADLESAAPQEPKTTAPLAKETATAEADVFEQSPTSEVSAAASSTGSEQPKRAGRKRVPDEVYVEKLRALVEEAGGVMPSIREAARLLGVGQDRARRLVDAMKMEVTKE